MTIGQPSGPPATYRQVQQLTDLIHAAGHIDFRDARGPLGLTQRQAGGKFTRDEADAFIERLEHEAHAESAPEAGAGPDGIERHPSSSRLPPVSRREAERLAVLRKIPDDTLAAELQRRGWIVMEP